MSQFALMGPRYFEYRNGVAFTIVIVCDLSLTTGGNHVVWRTPCCQLHGRNVVFEILANHLQVAHMKNYWPWLFDRNYRFHFKQRITPTSCPLKADPMWPGPQPEIFLSAEDELRLMDGV